ncbi:MAG: molybdate ABC transporter substrate-binding protein [Desulfobulbaceae bacterium]|nr:molybdate ABC transporter substrate-binding protein [Desulfobulbaceae bacterium]HIJ79534.1 molybdate ABC transporter substrate-binding protein [Deltaproteobacteria bacterium]
MMNKLKGIGVFWVALLMVAAGNSSAAAGGISLTVGVAANFILPMDELIMAFTDKTSIRVHPVYSSTGKLYAQIVNGAPFDVFLAADSRRPQMLVRQKLAQSCFLYAKGQTVLWAKRPGVLAGSDWRQAVLEPKVRRIGIASPESAPYGEAAASALKNSDLWAKVKAKLVYGQSVAQSFMFCRQGGVDLAFVALSQALSPDGRQGEYLPVAEAPLIMQNGCILARSKQQDAARQFVDFLLSAAGRTIISKYGYQ